MSNLAVKTLIPCIFLTIGLLRRAQAQTQQPAPHTQSSKLQADSTNATPAKKVAAGTVSGNDKRKAVLLIVNNTGRKIKMYWIDFGGKAHPYGEMPAHSSNKQLTYISNVWKITDAKGRALGYFLPTTDYAIATIN